MFTGDVFMQTENGIANILKDSIKYVYIKKLTKLY